MGEDRARFAAEAKAIVGDVASELAAVGSEPLTPPRAPMTADELDELIRAIVTEELAKRGL